jgi:hypothetical protein
LSKIIDVPLTEGYYTNSTYNFFWNFIYSNGIEQNTTILTQNVFHIFLSKCNSTYTTNALNFIVKDEKTNELVNSTFGADFHFWFGSGSIYKNYTISNSSYSNSSHSFCISPSSYTFKTDMDAEYTSTDYFDRTRHLRTAQINNNTNNITLYLLNNSLGIKFFFKLQQELTPLSNAIITIDKQEVGNNTFKTIGIRESDSIGNFIEYLELDKIHKFYITKNLVLIDIKEITSSCTATPCEKIINVYLETSNVWNSYYDVYANAISYNISFDPTSKIITFTFVDLTGLAKYFRLQVNKISYNETGQIICNNSIYTTAGSLNCNLTGHNGDFITKVYISKSPEIIITTFYSTIKAIKDIVGSEGLLFTLVLIIVVGLVGAWNPVVGIILVTLVFFLSVFSGFIGISYTSIILIVILAILIIIKMGRGYSGV